MYDWNETSSSKGGYIANKTHWVEYGQPVAICGGDLYLPSKYNQQLPFGGIYYTEYTGQKWFDQGGATEPIQINGPTYLEAIIEEGDNGWTAHYHVTPVFTHTQKAWYWNHGSRSLLDILAGGSGGSGTYYKYGFNAVHIKKCELFDNDNDFVNYCQERLGDVDTTNGPTQEQQTVAKAILDEFAYKSTCGYIYVVYDSSAHKVYTQMIDPTSAWKTYWEYAPVSDGYGYTGDHFCIFPTYSSSNPLGNSSGWYFPNLWPYASISNNDGGGVVSEKIYGTWGDMGETGLATYDPVTYHPLDIHYLPQEIQQMMEDVSKYLQAITPVAIEA